MLEELMHPQSSFAVYREHLASTSPPCIPFIAVYLSDLILIEEGNPNLIDGFINLDKCQLVYEVIAKLQLYQNESFKFPRLEPLASYLEALPRFSEEQLYDISLMLEPREASTQGGPATPTTRPTSSFKLTEMSDPELNLFELV